jgi:hypothetical protein
LKLYIISIFASACTTTNEETNDLEAKAKVYCDGNHYVAVCGNLIKVMDYEKVPGRGPTFYKEDNTKIECPVVQAGYESLDCKNAIAVDCQVVCEKQAN